MKNYLRKAVALASFAVVLTGAALAQSSAHLVHANIPFRFDAGGQQLPAGEYTIAVNMEDRVVTLSRRATGSSLLVLGSADDSSRDDRTVLTFELAGGEVYALREVRGPDLGVSFNAKAHHGMRAQNQKGQSVTIIAEMR